MSRNEIAKGAKAPSFKEKVIEVIKDYRDRGINTSAIRGFDECIKKIEKLEESKQILPMSCGECRRLRFGKDIPCLYCHGTGKRQMGQAEIKCEYCDGTGKAIRKAKK